MAHAGIDFERHSTLSNPPEQTGLAAVNLCNTGVHAVEFPVRDRDGDSANAGSNTASGDTTGRADTAAAKTRTGVDAVDKALCTLGARDYCAPPQTNGNITAAGIRS